MLSLTNFKITLGKTKNIEKEFAIKLCFIYVYGFITDGTREE